MSGETSSIAAVGGADPRPAAVTFITTEHFTLQGARAATIAESTGRATMFLGSVSAGLVALGLIATATRLGATFYAFGVIVLATLSFVGLVTFERVLQSGIEDHGYAQRIARLRAFYFDCAPEITGYLCSVPPPQRLSIQGLDTGSWRGSRTIAGMVGVVTAVLAGSAAGLIAAVAADHSAVAGFVTGGVVAFAAAVTLMRVQNSAWRQVRQHPYFDCQKLAVPSAGSNSTAGGGGRPGRGPRQGRSSGQPLIAVEGGSASHDRKNRGEAGEVAGASGHRVETVGGDSDVAAGLPRSGVVTSAPGSASDGRAGQLKPGHFRLPALPPQAEVRAAAADSILLAVACLISYWLTTRALSLVYSVSPGDDALGGMWAVIATVFLFRDSYDKSLAAAVSRMAATLVSFALCLAYLAFLPFTPWGLAIVVGLSVLVAAVIGRPGDEITAGITTAVVLVAASLSPHDAWRQPILRLADTAIGVAVGLVAAWLGLHAVRPVVWPSGVAVMPIARRPLRPRRRSISDELPDQTLGEYES